LLLLASSQAGKNRRFPSPCRFPGIPVSRPPAGRSVAVLNQKLLDRLTCANQMKESILHRCADLRELTAAAEEALIDPHANLVREKVELEVADGTRMTAYAVRPEGPVRMPEGAGRSPETMLCLPRSALPSVVNTGASKGGHGCPRYPPENLRQCRVLRCGSRFFLRPTGFLSAARRPAGLEPDARVLAVLVGSRNRTEGERP
jgi:hypothetical protein